MTTTRDALPRLPDGTPGVEAFPAGAIVDVNGGQYHHDHGVIADNKPDLRPGSVWVALAAHGIRLVPATDCGSAPSSSGQSCCASSGVYATVPRLVFGLT